MSLNLLKMISMSKWSKMFEFYIINPQYQEPLIARSVEVTVGYSRELGPSAGKTINTELPEPFVSRGT